MLAALRLARRDRRQLVVRLRVDVMAFWGVVLGLLPGLVLQVLAVWGGLRTRKRFLVMSSELRRPVLVHS